MQTEMDEEGNQTFIRQIVDLWVNPEIERRRQAGILSDDFGLYRLQIIFRYGCTPEVRLNDEVKILVAGDIGRTPALGEPVRINEFEAIHSIDLTELDDNAGHVTLFIHRGRWVGRFDFQYYTVSSRQHVGRAREYMDIAGVALDRGFMGPLVDNLYSAAELLAVAELQMHDKTIATGIDSRGRRVRNQHEERRRRYAQWAQLGNTEQRFADLLDHLWDLRGTARYMEEGPLPTGEAARDMLATAEAMYTHLDARVPRRRIPREAA